MNSRGGRGSNNPTILPFATTNLQTEDVEIDEDLTLPELHLYCSGLYKSGQERRADGDYTDEGFIFWGWVALESPFSPEEEAAPAGIDIPKTKAAIVVARDNGDYINGDMSQMSQVVADFEALIFALAWAEENEQFGLVCHIDSQEVVRQAVQVEILSPTASATAAPTLFTQTNNTGVEREVRQPQKYVLQVREMLDTLDGTLEYVPPEQNHLAVSERVHAYQKRNATEHSVATGNVSELKTWARQWETQTRDTMLEMLEVIEKSGLTGKRPWLNLAMVEDIDSVLEQLNPLIRAYEDTQPLWIGGSGKADTDADDFGSDDLDDFDFSTDDDKDSLEEENDDNGTFPDRDED